MNETTIEWIFKKFQVEQTHVPCVTQLSKHICHLLSRLGEIIPKINGSIQIFIETGNETESEDWVQLSEFWDNLFQVSPRKSNKMLWIFCAIAWRAATVQVLLRSRHIVFILFPLRLRFSVSWTLSLIILLINSFSHEIASNLTAIQKYFLLIRHLRQLSKIFHSADIDWLIELI